MVMGSLRMEADVVVVGGGPGGYVAAIRAADLGRQVILVEERDRLGGVCLLEGCIPSKALINAVEVARSAREAKRWGMSFEGGKIDVGRLRSWTDEVAGGLSKGVAGLLERRGVEVVHGRARLDGRRSLAVENGEVSGIDFRRCILATGSSAVRLPAAGDLPVWSSREALDLSEVPERLIVIGGGYIGLELGMVHAGLGSKVVLLEATPTLLAGVDDDIVKVVARACDEAFDAVHLGTRVVGVERTSAGYGVTVESAAGRATHEASRVLVAIGRRPNSEGIGLEHVGVKPNERGFIEVDSRRRTSDPDVFAIGDLTPGPMLAHKASREGKVAASVASGRDAEFDNRTIPAVVFTDPEIALTGLSERDAAAQGIPHKVSRFPMTALGRARTMGRQEGFIKILSDPETDLVLGVGIVAAHASELIAEATLGIEMGATVEDLAATIHPHPTLSEANMEVAEVAEGLPVHVNPPRAAR
jgi:dihydrolipoamide dehydrogenase